MSRPRKDEAPDLSKPVALTAGVIARASCPPGKQQAFLRDAEGNGLRVRLTRGGSKVFVFEQRLKGQTIRRSIGDVSAWTIDAARAEAKRLSVMLDAGTDPREVDRQQAAQRAQERAQERARDVTVEAAWARYMVEGSPKRRDAWKPRYVLDMQRMVAPGGEPRKRGKGTTLPGHLVPLMGMRLNEITEDTLAAWFNVQRKRSKHQATRALMVLRGLLRWASAQPELRALVDRDAGRAPAIVESLPAAKRRMDVLEAAQVEAWWQAVQRLPNPTASAYLRALLLTGARREEMATLRWDAVDFRWCKLTIADKVDDTRIIPLSRYMAAMLAGIPRGRMPDGTPNPYVFSSSSAKAGRSVDVRASLARELREAGIDALTPHGLRRSFSLLGEAAGAPAGAIAQVMGHKPSAVAEGYRPRSLDALRPHLQRIEDHILSLAGVPLPAEQQAGPRLVAVTRAE